MARSGAETPQGGAPAIPTLIRSDQKSTYNDNRFLFYILRIQVYVARCLEKAPGGKITKDEGNQVLLNPE